MRESISTFIVVKAAGYQVLTLFSVLVSIYFVSSFARLAGRKRQFGGGGGGRFCVLDSRSSELQRVFDFLAYCFSSRN